MRNLIVPRERKPLECFDLAILLCRRYWRQLLIASLPGLIVLLAINLNMRTMRHEEPAMVAGIFLALVVLFNPFLSTPVTWVLGQLIFRRPVGVGLFLHSLRRSLASLFWLGFVMRALYLLLLLTFVFYPNYVIEVAILEQQSLNDSRRRVANLRRVSAMAQSNWYFLFSLVALLFIFLSTWAVAEIWQMMRYQVVFQGGFLSLLNPAHHLWPALLYWPVGVYLSAVRFLGYLDLRTRVEGWAVEQQFRTLATELAHAPH